jgi:hypothetical protein
LGETLAKIDLSNEYIVFLRTERFKKVELPKNWLKVEADFRHYSFAEQFRLPLLIRKYNPDVVHFPHFNIPIMYFGKYIVTVHDVIMPKFKGGEATFRPFPTYQIWRLGYYIAFAKAVLGASKIIVPSKSVKEELLDYYRVSPEKIAVIYE